MLLRRKILKLFGLSILFVSLPYQFLKSATKKLINPDLSKAQKDIMFNEGTERPFTSELLKEKRDGFIIVQIVEQSYFHQKQNSIVERVGLLFLKLCQELLKLKLIILLE